MTSKVSEEGPDILSPRKSRSLVSILKHYTLYSSDGVHRLNEDNAYRPTKGQQRCLPKTEERLKLRSAPEFEFYTSENEKSFSSKDMEVENEAKVDSKSLFSISDHESAAEVISEDPECSAMNTNVFATPETSTFPSPSEILDCTMGSSGVMGDMGKSSSASACLDVSYLTNVSTKFPRGDLSAERKSSMKLISKPQESNLFSIKRKRPTAGSPEISGISSNSSLESCPSVAKKVKFFPLITSTPTKSRRDNLSQHRDIKRVLNYSGEQNFYDESEKNKLDMTIGELERSFPFSETNGIMLSRSLDNETSPLALMAAADKKVRTYLSDQPHASQHTISNLVEQFSSKTRLSMNSPNQKILKRKIETIDDSFNDDPPVYGTDDWSLGNGKYDTKYPAEGIISPTNIRATQDLIPQQYKPLKQSFDDSYKLAPIQESYRKLDDSPNFTNNTEYNKTAPLSGRQRCLGYDSKMKPKTRLRRRFKSESDLFEKIVALDAKQPKNLTSEVLPDFEEDSLISCDMFMDGANIKLYSLSDPDRNVSRESDALDFPTVGRESVMESFCEQMHDLQMDNT